MCSVLWSPFLTAVLLPTCGASVGQVQVAQIPLSFGASWLSFSMNQEGLRVGGPGPTKGGAPNSKDVSPRGAAEAVGGCENDLSEQTIVGPRRSHFKGIDH